MKLRKADQVVFLSGKDKGKTGAVASVHPATGQVIVEGLNIAKRHTKPSSKQPKGGILEIAKPVPAGKVAFVCPECKKPSRLGYTVSGDNKERICRKCKAVVK